MSIFNSKIGKIGMGFATGGLAGAGAATIGGSPAGKALGLYQTGSQLFGGPKEQAPPNQTFGSNLGNDYSMGFGQDDMFSTMKKRRSLLGGGNADY